MSSIHETAYLRFKPDLSQRELEDIYTPTDEEHRLSRRLTRTAPARLYVMVLLKSVQRLGYFPMLVDVPSAILSFLTKAIGSRSIPLRIVQSEEKSNARQRFMEAIRAYQEIKPVNRETEVAIQRAATQAAQTKQELADIINVVIEELIRQRFELPAFSRLNRTAQRVRNQVNERYFRSLTDTVTPEVLARFDALLVVAPNPTLHCVAS